MRQADTKVRIYRFNESGTVRTVGQAFQKYPLAFALATADMEASYFLENEDRL